MGVLPRQNELFSILDSVESTNNYATGQAHAGLARHGQAWFAREQLSGRGQRGKTWNSAPGENIIMSLAIRPDTVFKAVPFLLSIFTANVCREFFAAHAGEDVTVKWPNDIYSRDRKTGGILIENIYKGTEWSWAIIGIGININQTVFDPALTHATSLAQITGKKYDVVLLAKQLHGMLTDKTTLLKAENISAQLDLYNAHLYQKDQTVKLKKGNAVFETEIIGVNRYGQLLTKDVMERVFEVGEVTRVL
ncbi:MAG: biotin--[acetyl-CoA-carboxylase] ligase [Ferruginibacter sp.]